MQNSHAPLNHALTIVCLYVNNENENYHDSKIAAQSKVLSSADIIIRGIDVGAEWHRLRVQMLMLAEQTKIEWQKQKQKHFLISIENDASNKIREFVKLWVTMQFLIGLREISNFIITIAQRSIPKCCRGENTHKKHCMISHLEREQKNKQKNRQKNKSQIFYIWFVRQGYPLVNRSTLTTLSNRHKSYDVVSVH